MISWEEHTRTQHGFLLAGDTSQSLQSLPPIHEQTRMQASDETELVVDEALELIDPTSPTRTETGVNPEQESKPAETFPDTSGAGEPDPRGTNSTLICSSMRRCCSWLRPT